ncbi:MAG: hypothetical protein UX04_C0002G0189 [Microgenomates group bacterium GW2011_GWF2_45_18]|nr:MAG: hypothetical protein UW18_C0009G0018 [Microgenomates group bacterium GW2011_GWF1_44_10]KKU02046.1 MAG: hypothetical protein UX04_C0002G0189 [Microgenomates group bacterium GW2011_GWF2_45_18]OGJ41543.1 MAG: hypothetical protein A2378_02805 [Candidatus Pacebacteria bacterium RIFOXYB1_FULL_44_10]HAU99298.1 hypothetical protein [Candidatus Paceibacterota bacterium]HAX01509.1 hypothetical protein [Candidatus Paceibacterota bacterium]
MNDQQLQQELQDNQTMFQNELPENISTPPDRSKLFLGVIGFLSVLVVVLLIAVYVLLPKPEKRVEIEPSPTPTSTEQPVSTPSGELSVDELLEIADPMTPINPIPQVAFDLFIHNTGN